MANLKDENKRASFHPSFRSFLNRIVPGQTLKLREGAYKHLKEREWIFNRIEEGKIYLLHESKAYGIVVGIDEIDWSRFEKGFILRNEKPHNKFLIFQKGD